MESLSVILTIQKCDSRRERYRLINWITLKKIENDEYFIIKINNKIKRYQTEPKS